jgi:glutamyl-tRNA synthetase
MSVSQAHVRVRFAPSPTGFFHIGSARTALFNWLFARHHGGTFVLRIEDTDAERNTTEALRVLLNGMRWLGLDWDEGPEVGGDFGPYFQSERAAIYQSYLERLRANGRAYDHDGAVFFRVSGRPMVLEDAVMGRIERTEEKDFPIFRSNGTPVFHFVNVVDDIAMQITHVIRGQDHLTNTNKHLELFEAFGVTAPVFAHIPLILKTEGSGKMSKRDQGSLIEDYERRHFLPEAVRNYLCLLGWSPKDDREIMPLQEIIERFDLPGINKSNARFDERKLSAVNGEYVRKLPVESLAWLARPVLHEAGVIEESADETYLQRVLAISQEKLRSLEEMPTVVRCFFLDDYPVDAKALEKLQRKGDLAQRVDQLLVRFATVEPFQRDELDAALHALAEANSVSAGAYMPVLRLAVSGAASGPDLLPMLAVLGRDRVLARLQRFRDASSSAV